jgi:hypothetical protein
MWSTTAAAGSRSPSAATLGVMVRDGDHRVSAARDLGAAAIEAEVVDRKRRA